MCSQEVRAALSTNTRRKMCKLSRSWWMAAKSPERALFRQSVISWSTSFLPILLCPWIQLWADARVERTTLKIFKTLFFDSFLYIYIIYYLKISYSLAILWWHPSCSMVGMTLLSLAARCQMLLGEGQGDHHLQFSVTAMEHPFWLGKGSGYILPGRDYGKVLRRC